MKEQPLLEGDFIEAAHKTTGMAHLIVENGISYIELDEEFKTDDGPDLFVLLHDDAVPESYERDNYISLGELQAKSGTQRYEIPEGTDVSEYGSVAIWCREFDVTFGYATLGAREAMDDSAPSDFMPLDIKILENGM
ncbi:DM13 domain-containing protein [Oscillatoriales cyanobacterium LEGE 11467]|uniref:DM13 domain-containing protein n=2 Tax=Zarconia TaxID=2992130 RepID=A0A928VV66_9CYAN|nr:DM13 domain-containing protein [Zarconia navalis LEGE 11467]